MSLLARFVPRAYREVLSLGGFGRFVLGSGISSFGDGMSAVGVVWLALQLAPPGREAIAVAAATVAFTLPSVLVGLLLGPVADRMGARRLLLFGSGTRGMFLAIIPLLHWMRGIDLTTYVALLACSSVFYSWAVAGRAAMVADIVDEPMRLTANSLLFGQSQIALVLGPGLAGLLVGTAGAASAIAFDAASYAALFAIVLTLPAGTGTDAEVEGDLRKSEGGFAEIARDRSLLLLFGVTLLFYMLYGPFEVALPLHVTQNLGGDARLLGALLSAFGITAFLGNLATGALGRRLEPWSASLVVTAGWGLAVVALGTAAGPIVAMSALAIGGLIYGPHPAMIWTVLQSRTNPEKLASVTAAWTSLVLVVTQLGVAFGGPLTAILGPRGALIASGGSTVVLALVAAAATAALGAAFGGQERTPSIEDTDAESPRTPTPPKDDQKLSQ